MRGARSLRSVATIMSIIVNTCAKCGHEWPQSGKTPPRRCPAAGCRTVKWEMADGQEISFAEVEKRKLAADRKLAKDLARDFGGDSKQAKANRALLKREAAKVRAQYPQGSTATGASLKSRKDLK